MSVVPEVTWAQRSSDSEPEKNYVYLTIVAPDVPESDLKLDIKDQSLSFKGTSTSKKLTYAIDLELYAPIDPKESKINHSGRDVALVLRKKELKEEFWPRLLKDNKKVHFLKTDFDKWVDEDEQDEAPEEDMNQMNPMGGAGGPGGDGGFGGIDFSKLGGGAGGMPGMGGMGGMGGMDLSGMDMGGMDMEGGGESSDDDADMPPLENDEESSKEKAETSASAPSTEKASSTEKAPSTEKPKIEEIDATKAAEPELVS